MDTEKSTEIEDTLNYIQFEYSLLVFLLISTVCTAAYYSGGASSVGTTSSPDKSNDEW